MSRTDPWEEKRLEIEPWITGYCDCLTARGAIHILHTEHDHTAWEEALRSEHRFIPDMNQRPFGVNIVEPNAVTDPVGVIDRTNFRLALRYYGSSNPNQHDPALSEYVVLEKPATFDVPNYALVQQNQLAYWWSLQWHNYQLYVSDTTPELRLAYRRYIENQLLAVLRNENWSDVTRIRKMDTAKITAYVYGALPTNQSQQFLDQWTTNPAYHNGYHYWDSATEVLVRDEIPYDPADPLTAPFEAAMNLADPRVATYVVVVGRDEVDRTATGIPSTHPWTILLDADGAPTGDTTGTPANEYWQSRLDAILTDY